MTVEIADTDYQPAWVDCPDCGAEVDAHRVLEDRRCTECHVHQRVFFDDNAPDPEAVEIEYPYDEPAGVTES